MGYTVVIGLQWGDEGKGRIVDYLAESHSVVARFQGGANAGHTVSVNGEDHIFHLIPSGMLRKEVIGLIGAGTVLDLEVLVDEIDRIEKLTGVSTEGRLFVDGRASVVMPYHKSEDQWEEVYRGGIGTTKRGIGPAYRDRYARIGLIVADLFAKDLKSKVERALDFNNQILGSRYGKPPFSVGKMMDYLTALRDRIRSFVADVPAKLKQLEDEGHEILLEGAQGTYLDIFFGTYPFVTSSHTVSGGASVGLGIGPNKIQRIIGVTKAYTTRVGRGPFPTELNDEMGELIRSNGNEFGATTGRPRRCGWLDLVALRYSVLLNGVTELAITKIDVLSGIEEIKAAVEYDMDGERIKYPPITVDDWARIKPIYRSFKGWEKFWGTMLPVEAEEFVKFIEGELGVKATLVSTGKERNSMAKRW